jgi:hypothetical protein
MSAPDFYFVVNSTARHIHDEYGLDVLIDYWRSLGREYYGQRSHKWRDGGPQAIARDWTEYFLEEPGAIVRTTATEDAVELDVEVCPAIKHLRECGREIVPYFCEHCDHTCGAMAEIAGYQFERTGGMGACQQRFFRASPATEESPQC